MQCPRCKNPMIVLELSEVEIDYCTDCGGIWLDSGELELLLEDSGKSNELLNLFSEDKNSKEKKLKCPICSKKMKKVLVGEKELILIDQCKNAHGLWFDKGELYDILKLGSLDEENKILELLHEMFKHNKAQENKNVNSNKSGENK